jgi:hypothetical protein
MTTCRVIYTGMAKHTIQTRYSGFILENAQLARKVMREAGIDFDELVRTPEHEWRKLPEEQRTFMEYRKKIGPANGLLGVYARAMLSPFFNDLESLHKLLVGLKDSLSELRGPQGNKMSPLQFDQIEDLWDALIDLSSQDFPYVMTDDLDCRKMYDLMPRKVRKEAWEKIYRDGEFQEPYQESDILPLIKRISGTDYSLHQFEQQVTLLAKSAKPITPESLINIMTQLVRPALDPSLYPNLVGIYGNCCFEAFVKSMGPLVNRAGVTFDGPGAWVIPGIAIKRLRDKAKAEWNNYFDNAQGSALVMLPVGPGLRDDSEFLVSETVTVDGELLKVAAYKVEIDECQEFIDHIRPHIMGDYEPLLRKRLAEFRVRRINAKED